MLRQLPDTDPFIAAEHAMHKPEHAVSQQTPSMQLPLRHSLFIEQT
jgi:hypothetical protein